MLPTLRLSSRAIINGRASSCAAFIRGTPTPAAIDHNQDVREINLHSNSNSARHKKNDRGRKFCSLIEKFFLFQKLFSCRTHRKKLNTSRNSTTKLSSSGRAQHAYAMVSKALVSVAAAVAQIVRYAKNVNEISQKKKRNAFLKFP